MSTSDSSSSPGGVPRSPHITTVPIIGDNQQQQQQKSDTQQFTMTSQHLYDMLLHGVSRDYDVLTFLERLLHYNFHTTMRHLRLPFLEVGGLMVALNSIRDPQILEEYMAKERHRQAVRRVQAHQQQQQQQQQQLEPLNDDELILAQEPIVDADVRYMCRQFWHYMLEVIGIAVDLRMCGSALLEEQSLINGLMQLARMEDVRDWYRPLDLLMKISMHSHVVRAHVFNHEWQSVQLTQLHWLLSSFCATDTLNEVAENMEALHLLSLSLLMFFVNDNVNGSIYFPSWLEEKISPNLQDLDLNQLSRRAPVHVVEFFNAITSALHKVCSLAEKSFHLRPLRQPGSGGRGNNSNNSTATNVVSSPTSAAGVAVGAGAGAQSGGQQPDQPAQFSPRDISVVERLHALKRDIFERLLRFLLLSAVSFKEDTIHWLDLQLEVVDVDFANIVRRIVDNRPDARALTMIDRLRSTLKVKESPLSAAESYDRLRAERARKTMQEAAFARLRHCSFEECPYGEQPAIPAMEQYGDEFDEFVCNYCRAPVYCSHDCREMHRQRGHNQRCRHIVKSLSHNSYMET